MSGHEIIMAIVRAQDLDARKLYREHINMSENGQSSVKTTIRGKTIEEEWSLDRVVYGMDREIVFLNFLKVF